MDGGLHPKQIDTVLLVGRATRMPRLQEMLASYFDCDPSKLSHEVRCCRGLLLMTDCAAEAGGHALQAPDVNEHPKGVPCSNESAEQSSKAWRHARTIDDEDDALKLACRSTRRRQLQRERQSWPAGALRRTRQKRRGHCGRGANLLCASDTPVIGSNVGGNLLN